MLTIILILTSMLFQTTMMLFDFNTQSSTANWQIVDDSVMGGRSNSSITLNKAGLGVFQGTVSLEIMVAFQWYSIVLMPKK
jgi:NADH dehydrogenase [ubiquinone] 1 alpha subcomplex assembly factor 1